MSPYHNRDTYPVLDARQLKRIERTHRGFLYQHLFAVGCLFTAPRSGAVSLLVERDEDIELVFDDRRLYIQVRTRSQDLRKSDIEDALHRFDQIREVHQQGARPLKAEFWIVSNVGPSRSLSKEMEHEHWPTDVLFRSPQDVSAKDAPLPPAWKDLQEGLKWCSDAARNVPFSTLAPETLVWKLAAVIQFICTGSGAADAHQIRVDELPQLFEQFVTQLHTFPASPVPYRAHEGEPLFESQQRVRLILGFSGAGKTAWASENSLHVGGWVAYFDAGETPGPAIAPRLARELAAQFASSHSEDFKRVFLPGSTGIDSLRALEILLKRAKSQLLVVLDNVHRIKLEELKTIIEVMPSAQWLLLAQPWTSSAASESLFNIRAERLPGWSLETIRDEFLQSGCQVSPEVCQRIKQLTGGLPLYVQNAARLTREYYQSSAEEFCNALESATNIHTTGQQAILDQLHQQLSFRASHVASILVIADIPLTQEEVLSFVSAPLKLTLTETSRALRDLSDWGIIESLRDGQIQMHDSFRIIARDKQTQIKEPVLSEAKECLANVLLKSLPDANINRFRLYCRLLPSIGKTRELIDVASGTSEYFHEFGLSQEFHEILALAADSKALSANDRFWAADTLAFWSLQQGDIEKASRRIIQMKAVIGKNEKTGSEWQALTIKEFLLKGLKKDLPAVRQLYKKAHKGTERSPTYDRILRYNYANALFHCGQFPEAETLTEQLISEYFAVLGLALEDVAFKNLIEIREKLGEKRNDIDNLKHLADTLDLRAQVLNSQGASSGLCRMHACKFYALARAVTSLIRVGQDFVDECLRRGDVFAARKLEEEMLLPHVKQEKLLQYLVPVHSQYAVVLAYDGDLRGARKIMDDIESYADAMPRWKVDFDNQKRLIELIATGAVALPEPSIHTPLVKRSQKRLKVGRNEKCPCGSGFKYKKCCGR